MQAPPSKYARIERERRFLLAQFPSTANVERTRMIADRYIDGTTLRLREQSDDSGPTVFKLTQKIPARASGAEQGFITTMYLTKEEFGVLAHLSAQSLNKTRYSVPLPSFILREVTEDERFTGGRLVRASRGDIETWLLEYGIRLWPACTTPQP